MSTCANSTVIMRLHRILFRMLKNEDGSSSIEYGMILAVIVILVMVAIDSLAEQTTGMWTAIATKSSNAMAQN